MEKLKELLFQAFIAGFRCSGEGYNAEYPFADKGIDPTKDSALIERFNQWLADENGLQS